jgi:membrane peptidoglycan carboxypeptidase
VQGSNIAFAPENEDDRNYGPITVQEAMNNSVNSAFAQMGVDIGMDKVLETAGALGMDTKDAEAVPAQTLGTMGASPLQMAGVYATFANHGKRVNPTILKSAVLNDRSVDIPAAIGGQVISRQAADTVTSVLTGVVDDGTGRSVSSNVYDVAGKTGTSDDNKSAWFTGYTPDLVTSVGIFGESATENGKQVTLQGTAGGGRVNGGGFPAQIWSAYMFSVLGDQTSQFELETDQGAGAPGAPVAPGGQQSSDFSGVQQQDQQQGQQQDQQQDQQFPVGQGTGGATDESTVEEGQPVTITPVDSDPPANTLPVPFGGRN